MERVIVSAPKDYKPINEWDDSLLVDHYLFQINFDYILISLPRYYKDQMSHLDFTEYLIREYAKKKILIKQGDAFYVPEVRRSYKQQDVIKMIDNGKLFKTYVPEVLYTYSDNAGKGYCMIINHTFLNFFERTILLEKNRQSAISSLLEAKDIHSYTREFLIKQVDGLYWINNRRLEGSFKEEDISRVLNQSFIKKLNKANKQIKQII